jgi:hypothetical protein
MCLPRTSTARKAIQLRAELDQAREAMLKAKLESEHAKEIAQAADHFPDFAGNAGKKKAAEKHGLAVERYREALAAWVQHILDS